MSAEIQFPGNATGAVNYVLVRDAVGRIWDTVTGAFQSYLTASYSGYVISAAEQGTASNYYTATFPAVTAASGGVFNVVAKRQTGVNPAESDPNVATNEFHWNGSIQVRQAELATSGQIGTMAPLRLARSVAVSGFVFKMVSSVDHITPFTSGVVSGQISRDGGSFGALQSGLAVGAYSEMGLGFFRVNLTSGDMNGNTIALNFQGVGISGGAADNVDFVIYTQRVSGS